MTTRDRGNLEDLPHDGTCDACEPDDATEAVRLCQNCGFSFCHPHAEEHSQKYASHHLQLFVSGDVDLEDMGRKTSEGASNREGDAREDATAAVEVNTESAKSQTEEPVLKKKCEEHGQDLTLYCEEHEQIICVLCAVTGAHKEHKLVTLNEAYEAMRSREPVDLRTAMLEMVERLKDKCNNPNVTRSEMKTFIQEQFEHMRCLANEEERKALHLVDLQEAMETARVSEVLAELNVRMMKVMAEMSEITSQLSTFNDLAQLKPEDIEQEVPSSCRRNHSPPQSPPRGGGGGLGGNSRHCDHPPPANGPW
ncbi:tripartite motif-containing protein 44 [Ambystoma mexicanum]|uniref:tripartite motif-containing protein 44 n=1 Tax=Ambystoma mexicanum TaxID=8296 RepID=UPI0037E78F2D